MAPAATLIPYRLPLRRPWVAARRSLDCRCGMLLQLRDREGRLGWGDCAPLPSSDAATTAAVFAALEQSVAALDPESPFPEQAALPAEVRWAIGTAQLDLAAQRQGLPLSRLVAPPLRQTAALPQQVAVNAALGPLDPECATRALAALEQGHTLGKIKVGLAEPEVELAQLGALVRATAGRLRLRLDANRAWPFPTAAAFLDALADWPIDAVEEPLATPNLATLAALQGRLAFPLAVDESLAELGVLPLFASRAVRRLVIKPARIGSPAATRALVQAAQQAGLEVVLTSVVDSAVGVAACAHLAAALAPKQAHGLATGAWLTHDVAPGLPLRAGHLHLPAAPGLGLHPQWPPDGANPFPVAQP